MAAAGIAPESRVGAVIQGEYHVESLLRDEDLGPVYRAQNPRLKGNFDVLMLRRESSPSLKVMVAVRNDLRKARNLTALGFHPIEQLADEKGVPGFAWEVLPGETLRERLTRGPLKVGQALQLCGVLGRALQEAHAEELIHGDVRPENVLLVKPEAKSPSAGRAVLLRYALHHIRWYARQQRLLLRRHEPLPSSEPFRYAPPELRAGVAKTADARADIYGLGLVLHECLGGVLGVPDASGALPPPLLQQNDRLGLTAELCGTLNVVIAGACATDPAGRVQTLEEFLRALRQVAKGANLPWMDEEGRKQGSIVRRLTGRMRTIGAAGGATGGATGAPSGAPSGDPSGSISASMTASMLEEVTSETADPTAPSATSPPPPLPPGLARDPGKTVPPRPRGAIPYSPETVPPRPPSAASADRRGDARQTMPLSRVPQGETQMLESPLQIAAGMGERAVERSGRRDITQLVAAVQQGKLDAMAAVQEAQGADIDLLKGPSWWPTRRDFIAAGIGALLMLLLLLAFGAFRH